MANELHLLPCGRNVTVWFGCVDCPDFPCKKYWANEDTRKKVLKL